MNKKIVFLPYDFDTAIGITNEGVLAFSYNLEDTDHTAGGSNIYNGQDSVLWNNVRQAFPKELKAMYQTLRSQGKLSYELIERAFEAHQGKWPEAIFNEDAWFKYLAPLVQKGDASYLGMLQGSKAEQRKWWLYNRFRYIDSKYNAGDALTDVITIRGYAKANVVITPYADIYAAVKYGSYLVQTRASRNTPYTMICPLDTLDDTEVYIYSASQLADVGDLSGFKVGYANFSMATKLQSLKLGDSDPEYVNGNLEELYLGNNVLLKTIDCRNCVALGTGNVMQSVDISGCVNIENAYFDNTAITGLTLPNGGVLKKLHLPDTVTNLTIRNQTAITEFVIPTGENITTLRLENVSSAVDVSGLLANLAAGSRVRLIGFSWDLETYAAAAALYDKLDTMRGLSESGGNLDRAQVYGTIHIDSLTGTQLASLQERYPDITVTFDHITSYLYYKTYDGSQTLYTETILDGGDGTYNGTPSRSSTAQYNFTFVGWSKNQDSQTASADATKSVTADRSVYAAYSRTTRTYTVTFAKQSADGGGTLQTVNNVPYGGSASYTGTTPTTTKGSAAEYPFEGWSPSPNNIQGNTTCYAVFGSPLEVAEIEDDWATIISKIEAGTATYKVGNWKELDLGAQGTVKMQIVGKGVDPLASGSGNAATSWVSMELLKDTHRMNPELVIVYKYPEVPSWTASGNTWTSQNRYNISKAKATWTISATSDGTLSIFYKTSNSNSSRNKITTLTVNGTAVATDYCNTSGTTETVAVNNGDTVTVYCEYDQLTASQNYYGTVTFSSTGTFTVSADVQDAPNRVVDYYTTGTGTIGSYDDTEMDTYLDGTIKPLIPEAVRSHLKSVTKYTYVYNTAGTSVKNDTSTEEVWIPSYREIFGGTGYESNGPAYSAVFASSNDRIKKNVSSGSAAWWWLRSAYTNSAFYSVSITGGSYYTSANYSGGVALGFCI